ncbi:MAG TPA: signal peptidase I [Candidatus Binataceae bacterium]|nr:signal peptidase I [Candidatus Binataceae bacterium]
MPEPLRKNHPTPASGASAEPVAEKSAAREYSEAFIIALVLAIILRTFFLQAYKIPSGSMEPTLLVGDHIIVNKLIYGLRLPDSFFGLTPFEGEIPWGHYIFKLEPVHRGDVVVFVFPPDPTKDFIKRVIGVPGDTIEVKNGKLYRDGALADDPHAHFELAPAERQEGSPRDYFGPLKVPEGQYLMMGDNRDRSYDGRFWGLVRRDEVEGRAMFIYWSWDSDGTGLLPIRWSRFARIVR